MPHGIMLPPFYCTHIIPHCMVLVANVYLYVPVSVPCISQICFYSVCWYRDYHIYSDCSRGLLRGTAPCHFGILPEHLNRGHTDGSSPSHPPAVLGCFLLREDTAISSHCVHTPNKFMLYTALSTGKNESERKNSNFYFCMRKSR